MLYFMVCKYLWNHFKTFYLMNKSFYLQIIPNKMIYSLSGVLHIVLFFFVKKNEQYASTRQKNISFCWKLFGVKTIYSISGTDLTEQKWMIISSIQHFSHFLFNILLIVLVLFFLFTPKTQNCTHFYPKKKNSHPTVQALCQRNLRRPATAINETAPPIWKRWRKWRN